MKYRIKKLWLKPGKSGSVFLPQMMLKRLKPCPFLIQLGLCFLLCLLIACRVALLLGPLPQLLRLENRLIVHLVRTLPGLC